MEETKQTDTNSVAENKISKKKIALEDGSNRQKVTPVKNLDKAHAKKVSIFTRLNIRLSVKERLLFAKYLSVLLGSGLTLDESIKVLKKGTKGPMKKILETLDVELQQGHTLADGLSHFPHIFSQVFINLLRAGESSGTLNSNLEYLSVQMQKQYELKKSIQGAMMYPAIILTGGLAVTVLIIVFILPNIVDLFSSLNAEIPTTTKILIWISYFFQTYPIKIIIGSLALFLAFVAIIKIHFTRSIIDKIILTVPIVGTIIKNATLARIFRLFGTLLKSGMPMEKAIIITQSVVSNAAYSKMLLDLKAGVTEGHNLTDVLDKYPKLVPEIAKRLILVGSETATLPQNLLYMAEFYEQEVSEASKQISVLIEPILIIFMGILVAFLAFSVLSPIYGVVSSI
ncbi:hypothetical protein CO057_00055 [Candidatus Uhrbacteria bacterium CG_4_9_14_0_2_um_filter_41_50]|uniref:Type II secretion system protein GspF domain-containing protein n=1 Tax=Candidatus Uhrbacteria bacterium CG_4_9_14_0_2_um_filter_41_50 TaxID=1975031 RepID=A0A2M8EQF3_9BACT|nr:MAG: hypothetical protein COZ45_01075 [Candidatus Uhrbacteria bacterium CG_4_10_14_3_um_filter_41_21]PIZ55517.1 MAG: hypothetical protein COY24_00035 [Candidatus Uhrbacteria bacterium CG_4_10_14_0_2_um_filter_41_21]PJB84586.1 MAG: hypothetical protein CO086_02830 [Candidatus Uhrbacteria bacterium CG_4_9_14_0_8_um_filter_41_16]PJC24966.1 MAG: hypothetical protein CO057_00055 [Candidatus Uhrbacteria bacterium CG_4_9_14_0_2_um_filter_41_50]PJE74668.1 MAG: hypothetical protein COV03_04260 [Candi